jgi:transposase
MKVALWAEIHRLHEFERLSARAIARRLHCSGRTVKKALSLAEPPVSHPPARGSILDPYKPAIDEILAKYPDLSAVRIEEEISKRGYEGEVTLVRDYLREVRPARGRIYQEVEYGPGDAMQVDWGHAGVVRIGESIRKVSVFVAVLCFSRLIYIEFTLSQVKAVFYRSVVRALRCFGGSTRNIIVDNLKAAVLEGSGRSARFHPEFEALCAYHGRMKPVACERADPESKGVVEGGVRYVKHNALKGRAEELLTFEDYRRLARYWPETIANVRDHETTRERPVDRFERERALLKPLPAIPYDTDEVILTVATPHARVHFDTNRYSVPPECARKQIILRADDAQLSIIHGGMEVARHGRSFEKHKIIIDPVHQKAALACRRRSRLRDDEARFDALGDEAKAFRLGLTRSPIKPAVHVRRLLELVRVYGRTEVIAAIVKALELGAYDAAYVTDLLHQERRRRQVPCPIPLTPKRRELVEEIDLEEPDPGTYDDLVS